MTSAMIIQSDNLRFTCTQCGDCCNGGMVIPLSQADVDRIARWGYEPAFFARPRTKGDFFPYEMRTQGGRCVFYSQSSCLVYPARALVCRLFPFWFEPLPGGTFQVQVNRDCRGLKSDKAVPVAATTLQTLLEMLRQEIPEYE